MDFHGIVSASFFWDLTELPSVYRPVYQISSGAESQNMIRQTSHTDDRKSMIFLTVKGSSLPVGQENPQGSSEGDLPASNDSICIYI